MMQTVNSPAFFADMFRAFGFGFLAAIWYHVLSAVLPLRVRILSWIFHLLFFSILGVLSVYFILGRTVSAQPRWFILLGFVLGASGYFFGCAAAVRKILSLTTSLARFLLRPVARGIDRTLGRALRALYGAAKNVTLLLHLRLRSVYNQLDKRRRKGESENGGKKSQKKRITAHTKT